MSDDVKDEIIRGLERKLRDAHDALPCPYEQLFRDSRERHIRLLRSIGDLAVRWRIRDRQDEAKELDGLLTKENLP